MEKQIKMSIETAREMYKDSTISTKNWLLENFTKEELEPKKGFTWEDSFEAKGYFMTMDGAYKVKGNGYKNAFKTREQAESALAFAQLSHIVARYNEGKYANAVDGTTFHYFVTAYNGKDLGINTFEHGSLMLQLQFCEYEDALTSIEVNADLWKKYWMLK